MAGDRDISLRWSEDDAQIELRSRSDFTNASVTKAGICHVHWS
jgi:hypothetical protein